MSRFSLTLLVGGLTCLLSQPVQSQGTTSPLYVTDFSGVVHVVQGTAQTNSWIDQNSSIGLQPNPAIAVRDTVQTFPQAIPLSGTSVGAEYSIAGVATGVTYSNTVGCCFRDGTTDGTYNYAIRQAPGTDLIYRFGLDWSNPEALPGFSGQELSGITYDPRNNTFWTMSGSLVLNLNLTTNDFPAAFYLALAGDGAIAFDAADQTLWILQYQSFVGTTFQQFSSEAGLNFRQPLQTFTLPFGVAGAEFALQNSAVPEPGTWAMLLLGFGGIGFALRRQKTAVANLALPKLHLR